MEINIQGFCRVCTSRNIEMNSVYEHYKFSEQFLQIFKVIKKCASIQIQKHDGLPERICKKCMEHLCQAYSFKQLCENSDYKFRHNLVVEDKIVPTDVHRDKIINIQSDDFNKYEITEELGCTSNYVNSEIKCEFYEAETHIQYGIIENQLDEKFGNYDKSEIKSELCAEGKKIGEKDDLKEETIKKFTTIQNLDCLSNLHETDGSSNLHESENSNNSQTLYGSESNFTIRDTEKKLYNCTICNRSFNRKNNLKTHLMSHTGDKPFKCDLCDKSFTRRAMLIFHKRAHAGEKPYKCEICDKAFGRKQKLNEHAKIHTGDKSFKCEICNKSFAHRCTLNKHIMIHTGDKPYKCEICDKHFRYQQALNNHMNIHTGDTPYKCEVCNKSFSQKSNLNMHIKIHTGVKPYACDVCNKSFAHKCTLNKHAMIHTECKTP